MIKIDFVSTIMVFDELKKYVEEKKSELKEYGGELNVDWLGYSHVKHNSFILTLRHDGKLVGFSGFILFRHPRNEQRVIAENHGLYVEKQYRKAYGARMIPEADKFLKRLGVMETVYTNDEAAFGRLLSKSGYKPTYTVWSVKHG